MLGLVECTKSMYHSGSIDRALIDLIWIGKRNYMSVSHRLRTDPFKFRNGRTGSPLRSAMMTRARSISIRAVPRVVCTARMHRPACGLVAASHASIDPCSIESRL